MGFLAEQAAMSAAVMGVLQVLYEEDSRSRHRVNDGNGQGAAVESISISKQPARTVCEVIVVGRQKF